MSKDELRPAVGEFAPIPEDSVLLSEHAAVMASVALGGWMSAALDDPAVCEAMKADINRWFSAGFLYLNEVRELIEADRAEVARLTEQRVRKYWYRQGKDDAWEAVVDRIATWLETHQFGEFELDDASITIAGFIRAGEWKQ